jgi:hypothetical protein
MIKAGLVPEWTGENLIIPHTFLKKGQAGTAEKDLIAEAQSNEEEENPSAA